jgi:hypothetical protein
MEIRFEFEPREIQVTPDLLDRIQNQVIRTLEQELRGGAPVSWLEAGGYVKWAKASSIAGPDLSRLPVSGMRADHNKSGAMRRITSYDLKSPLALE